MSSITIYDSKYEPLKGIEWNFVNSSQDSSANIHPYPARFINDIPKELIRLLAEDKNGIVLDPFCGSGTTLLEAKKAGMKSVGIDLNPIACLISRVRTSTIPVNFLATAELVATEAQKNMNDEIDIPAIPNLNHWFKHEIQTAIAALLQQINAVEDIGLSDPLRLALSSIIVRISNQESDTRYAAIENNHTAEEVFSGFVSACRKVDSSLSHAIGFSESSILCKDILKVTPDEIGSNISLVITSPPYPNAYEYWLYHKYRMWWLGYDPIKVRTFEIGARPNYHKKNGQTSEDFKNQMSNVFDLFTPLLNEGGHVCFVIGRSIIRGKEVNNAEIIARVALNHNLKIKANIEREIASIKKSFNLKYGKIRTENILVFRKET